MPNLLSTLKLPQDLKKLSLDELNQLAGEIRQTIMDVVPKTGGHMGTNLGVVELTLAIHHIFDIPNDQLVFDVGHQAYPHKLLTGRFDRFHQLRQKDGISGFPSPWESPYDNFLTGHAGTSISTALGLAIGFEAQKQDRKVVAIIGDGSICGLSFEGFNQLGAQGKDVLVILNDNKMAISPTVGAFSKYLTRVRSEEYYQKTMTSIKESLLQIPVIGEPLEQLGEKAVQTMRDNLLPDHFFSEMGLHYYGPVDGHDLGELILMINKLKNMKGPILLHVLTEKGKGAKDVDKDPYKFHTPPSVKKPKAKKKANWSQCFVKILMEEAEKNEKLFAITAAMAQGTQLEKFMEKFPDRSTDTGIAEAHAVTMAGALGYSGLKPVVLIYSTFLQRAYDSIMHDICLQKEGAVIFALDRAGLVGDDGPSHHGVFDIAYMRHLPKMVLMAPKDGGELAQMFKWAQYQNQPVAIRYPRGSVPELDIPGESQEIELGKPEILKKGERVAILAYGAMVEESLKAVRELEVDGFNITLVNLRFAKPLCIDSLRQILEDHETVITIEDHVLNGGVGSAVLEAIQEKGLTHGRIIRLGIPDEFVPVASRPEQMAMLGLDASCIATKVRQEMNVDQVVEQGC